MRTKKLFSVALSTTLLSVFLFLVLFIRIGVRYHENDVLTQFLTGHHEFTPFTTSLEKPYKITQYLRNVPMEEMDFSSYDARIKVIQAVRGAVYRIRRGADSDQRLAGRPLSGRIRLLLRPPARPVPDCGGAFPDVP